MPPEDRHYAEDNFYRKGQFHVRFRLEPLDDVPLDPEAQYRALQELLHALQDETELKISAFVDLYEEDDEEEVHAVFVVYNKLGTSSLAKLRRFMDEHLVSERHPRIILVDPRTEQKFRASEFTIQYLFHDFVAKQEPDDWVRLRDLVQLPDQGYAELMRAQDRTAMYRPVTSRRFTAVGPALSNPSVKHLQSLYAQLVDLHTRFNGVDFEVSSWRNKSDLDTLYIGARDMSAYAQDVSDVAEQLADATRDYLIHHPRYR